MRDETDLSGLKLAIDLKRGVDPDKLMAKLYKLTPLEDAFACNFNVLIAGSPKVLGSGRSWRNGRPGGPTVRRRVYFVMKKKQDKLHLLEGPQAHPAGHRQGHPHHPGDGGGGRGHPQPDDRLRHRPGPGGSMWRRSSCATSTRSIFSSAPGRRTPAG